MTMIKLSNKEFRNVAMARDALAQNNEMFNQALQVNFENQIKTICEAIRAHFKMLPKSFQGTSIGSIEKNRKLLRIKAHNTFIATSNFAIKKEVVVDFHYDDYYNNEVVPLKKLSNISFLSKEEKLQVKEFQKAIQPFVKMLESLNLFSEIQYKISISEKKTSISSKMHKGKTFSTL